MNRNHLVVLNVCSSYGRMLLTAALGLLSTRWILVGLGPDDYGLLAVVGGLIGLFTFINTCMAGSAQRHFAYAIGGGDIEEVRRWFNTSVIIHLGIAVAIVGIGVPVGQYLVTHVLEIPDMRKEAASFVLYCSFLSTFFNVASVPFVGMFIAKQRLMELAVFALSGSLLNAGLAFSLLTYAGDRLQWYAGGIAAISMLVLAAQFLRVVSVFPECKIIQAYWWDKPRIKELFSFAGWTLFGVVGNLGRYQGMTLLINMFCGVRTNSALGVANQVSGQMDTIAQGVLGALAPEITASEGRGERERMISLSLRASKFSTLMVLILLLPLTVELEGVLTLWLKTPPPDTATFCLMILWAFLIDRTTSGYMVAVSAHGKIAAYQATLGGVLLLTFPLAYLVLKLGWGAVAAVSCFFATGTICSLGRIWWVKQLLGVPVRRWIMAVAMPCCGVGLPAFAILSAIHYWMPTSVLRIAVVFGVGSLGIIAAAWLWGMEEAEKTFVRSSAKRFLAYVGWRAAEGV